MWTPKVVYGEGVRGWGVRGGEGWYPSPRVATIYTTDDPFRSWPVSVVVLCLWYLFVNCMF